MKLNYYFLAFFLININIISGQVFPTPLEDFSGSELVNRCDGRGGISVYIQSINSEDDAHSNEYLLLFYNTDIYKKELNLGSKKAEALAFSKIRIQSAEIDNFDDPYLLEIQVTDDLKINFTFKNANNKENEYALYTLSYEKDYAIINEIQYENNENKKYSIFRFSPRADLFILKLFASQVYKSWLDYEPRDEELRNCLKKQGLL